MPLRSLSPSRQASGNSTTPAQKQRWKVMSAAVMPMSMPCRAATKPAAHSTAAPAPQRTPMAVYRDAGVVIARPLRLPERGRQ